MIARLLVRLNKTESTSRRPRQEGGLYQYRDPHDKDRERPEEFHRYQKPRRKEDTEFDERWSDEENAEVPANVYIWLMAQRH